MATTQQDFHIGVNERVKLKDGFDHLYPAAYVGSEGWIRNRGFDAVGFPRVFVEWDKKHWTYNGEPNGWTFEGHFDIVKERSRMGKDINNDELARIVQNVVKQMRSDDEDEGRSTEMIETPGSGQEMMEKIGEAFEKATESEAFLLITVRKQKQDGGDILIPEIHQHAQNEECEIMIDLQVAQIAATHSQKSIIEDLEAVLDDKD